MPRHAFDPTDVGWRLGRSRAPHGVELWCRYDRTTGVYGDCGGERIDETRAVRPHNPRAHRRVDAEQRVCRNAVQIDRCPAADAVSGESPQGSGATRRAPPKLSART